MLSCLKTQPLPSTSNHISSPASQAYSVANTPRSSAQLSPIINLTHEYALAVQTDSYGEIRRIFEEYDSVQAVDIEHVDIFEEPQLLEHVLQPSQERVQEMLSLLSTKPLSSLVATYFGHSEETSRLCFLLYQSVRRARCLYAPIHNLLDDLPLEFDSDSYTLSKSQCDMAYNVLARFDSVDNPFLSPDSQKFDDICRCFSCLREKLEHHAKKSKSKSTLMRYCMSRPAMCLMATGVGVAITALAIATHALLALVGSPICLAFFSSKMRTKERVHLAQLQSASMNAYVLQKDLDTIKCLVAHLNTDVENDKQFIHLGLERGDDSYFIQEILKHLRRNRPNFGQRLESLEDHLFLCFAAINRTRSRLLHEIHLHQNPGSPTL